jgi:acetoin utilization deacetylase AcuC-like enzyme
MADTAASGASRTGLLRHANYKLHEPGESHPERPERYDAVVKALERSGVMAKLVPLEPRRANEDEVALCHTRSYIETAKRDIQRGAQVLSTGDTDVSEKSWDVALQAAGGILNTVDAVMKGEVRKAFCVVRPPGHHATPARGMGFCVFNNIAVGARYAQRKHGLERVLIADWDVHHGNGTQDIFYSDPSVFFFSTHQSPWYPGTGAESETGEGRGKGTTLNCPFPAGSGREEILGAFRRKLLPAAKEFKPDLVFVSAGFDSRRGDPLGRFTLSDKDFAELTSVMLEIASVSAQGRLISVLEGGYDLEGLGLASAKHAEALEKG